MMTTDTTHALLRAPIAALGFALALAATAAANEGPVIYNSTNVPVVIPDTSTVTSKIVVPANGPVISDVNVSLDITHTFDNDLDVFLESPSGTTVELFTDVGGAADNFTRTTLDDEASPSITAGAAPFRGTFRPEGNLSDFDGEVSAGTWTLSITDDAGGDTGTLHSFHLTFNSPSSTQTSLDVPHPITDNTTVTSEIIAPPLGIVKDVNVALDIAHTFNGDLNVFLISPRGTMVELFTDVGGSSNNMTDTVIDDEAPDSITAGTGPFTGTFRPEGLLAAFDGEPIGGEWILQIFDDAGADQGTLNRWEIIFNSGPETHGDTDVPIAIPDQGTIALNFIAPLSSALVTDVNVLLDIDHTFAADLDVTLRSPLGTMTELFTDVGGSGNNFTGTIIDDEADTPITGGAAPFAERFQPEGSLSAFNGERITGPWVLTISDDAGGDVGTVNHWAIVFNQTDIVPSATTLVDLFGWTYSPTAISAGALGANFPGDPNASGAALVDLGADSGGADLRLSISGAAGPQESLQGWFSPIGVLPFQTGMTPRIRALIADSSTGAGTDLVEARMRWFYGSFGNMANGNLVARPRVNRPAPAGGNAEDGTEYHLMFDHFTVASAASPSVGNNAVNENDVTLAFETVDLFSDYRGSVDLKRVLIQQLSTDAIRANQCLLFEATDLAAHTVESIIDFGDNAASTVANPNAITLTTSVGNADGGAPLVVYGNLPITLANAERTMLPQAVPAPTGHVYRAEFEVDASGNSTGTPLPELVLRVRTTDSGGVPLDTTETHLNSLREGGGLSPSYSGVHTYAAYLHFPRGFAADGVDPDGAGPALPYGVNVTASIALQDNSDIEGGSVTVTGMRLYSVEQQLLP